MNGDDQCIIIVWVYAKGILFRENDVGFYRSRGVSKKSGGYDVPMNTNFVYLLQAALERPLPEIPPTMVFAL